MITMKVVLAVTNDLINDSRVNKISNSLSSKYDVVVIGLNQGRDFNYGEYKFKTVLVDDSKLKTNTKNVRSKLKRILGPFSIFGKDISIYLFEKKSGKKLEYSLIIEDADIYVANDLNTLGVVYKIAKLMNKKVIYDSHELCVDQYSKSIIGKLLWEKEERKYIKNVDAVITTNEYRSKILKDRYKLTNLPFIIRNIPNLNKKVNKLSQNKNKIKILYTGNYTGLRGLEELVASMEYVLDIFQLHLMGYGNLQMKLIEIIKEKKLQDKVFFHDPVPQNIVVDETSKYDLGVVTYLPTNLNNYYCSPNKLYEYIQAGLGIISINLPEPKNIIEKYGNGVLFDSYDPKEIANVINTLKIENIIKFKKNSIAAKEDLCWENEEKKLFSIYESI